MTLDPQKVVQEARAKGEPELAEWLQREVDDIRRDQQLGRLKVGFYLAAFWAAVIVGAWWAFS